MEMFHSTLNEEEFDKKEFGFANTMLHFKEKFPKSNLNRSPTNLTFIPETKTHLFTDIELEGKVINIIFSPCDMAIYFLI